ncbi:MAG: glycosyltransferase family 2 protein [Saprospiraceae bacterium]
MEKPAIVIAAYNRPESLDRLLHSVGNAYYPCRDIPLIISIDKSEKDDVLEIAEHFTWPYGKKILIKKTEHLGLKKHILACGDLTGQYGVIILLEDDLLVSPYFYEYAVSAISFYEKEEKIAGISLYHYLIAESCFFPFQPIHDGSDVYFIQFAASWGQVWTKTQWGAFRQWLLAHPDITMSIQLPAYIEAWSEQSWKKHFIQYLIAEGKYFVFPRVSYSTNFSELGIHEDKKGLYQTELQLAQTQPKFKQFKESIAIYDAWFELLPECLNKLTDELKKISYAIDLYGQKNNYHIKEDYLLTTKYVIKAEKSFGAEMTPNIANVIFQIKGNEIALAKREFVIKEKPPNFWYHQKIVPIADYLFGADLKKEWWQGRYLTFDIIIKIEGDLQHCRNTIASVEMQRYPFLHYILITQLPEKKITEIATEFQLANYSIINSDLTNPIEICHHILQHAKGELLGILNPGDRYLSHTLNNVKEIFQSLPNIEWISGLPTWLNQNGNTVLQARATLARYSLKTIGRSTGVQAASVFWRKSLLQKSISNFPKTDEIVFEERLWQAFFQFAQLHTGCFFFGGSPLDNRKVSRKYTLNPLWYFYKNDIVFFRYFYKKQKALPDFIRYDYEHDCFYLSPY